MPLTRMCKKQGAVSHSSSEAEVVSLDDGVRMEGISALILWEQVIEVLCPRKKEHKDTERNVSSSQHWSTKIGYVLANIPEPSYRAKLLILENNDAVIKMTVKERSPALRRVPRAHRIDPDWLFERIREDPSIDL